MHEIENPKENRCDKVVEDLIEAPHDFIEGYTYPLILEGKHLEDEIHLHEDKVLISYVPFKFSKLNDESFDELEREAFVETPSDCEYFLDLLIHSCEVEHGNQEDEDAKFLF